MVHLSSGAVKCDIRLFDPLNGTCQCSFHVAATILPSTSDCSQWLGGVQYQQLVLFVPVPFQRIVAPPVNSQVEHLDDKEISRPLIVCFQFLLIQDITQMSVTNGKDQ